MPQVDWKTLLDQLVTLFTNPTSNFGAALALYGVVAIVVLIVLIGGVMLVLGSPEDEAGAPIVPAWPQDEPGETPSAEREHDDAVVEDDVPPPRGSRPAWVTLLTVLGIVAATWAVAGYTTSNDSACAGCHQKSPHAAADEAHDPHAAVTCTQCHEPSGAVSRAVFGVPSRVLHVAGHLVGFSVSSDYGRVTRSACVACHSADIAGVTTDPVRGIRMSHKEPLAASAACLDCHALQSGTLSARGVGMDPCLRCHDSKTASSGCATCHDKKASAAARVRKVAPAVQIPNVTCGGCHDEKKECDSCHGVRLPHSQEFMAYAHARAGAVDFWFNGGRTCAKCHTATRNPCSKCHSTMLGSGHGPTMAQSHQSGSTGACDSCHGQHAYTPGRDFCKDLCHSPASVAASPR